MPGASLRSLQVRGSQRLNHLAHLAALENLIVDGITRIALSHRPGFCRPVNARASAAKARPEGRGGPCVVGPFLVRRLAQEGAKCRLVNVGAVTDFDVPDELACTLEKSIRIPQCGAAEESKLHVIGCRVDIGDRDLPVDPASVAPLHGLLELWSNALHEFP